LCNHCRREYTPKQEDFPDDFPFELIDGPIYEAVGCRECRDVGYSGRMGVYELLTTTDEIRQLATDRSSTWEIKKAAAECGMETLRDDGWLKVIDGKTTIDEIIRITKSDRTIKRK
jgi:general secretion pathway protein E/type IV pilus assembly protein PilB